MKKYVILILILLLFTGCFNKWSYKINDNYHIEHESVNDIYLYKGDTKVLDKYVSHYAILQENYLYLETMRDYNGSVVLLYYLVNMETDEVEGPYTTHTVMDAMAERGLMLEDTIDTMVRSQDGNKKED